MSPIKSASSVSGDRIAVPTAAPGATIPMMQAVSGPPTPPASAPTDDGQGRATLPPPPPMPMASMVSKARILREGEQAYTAEQLKDILAGGKNDEAPDLAALKVGDNGWYNQIFNEDYLRTIPKSEPRQTRREARFIVDRLGLEHDYRFAVKTKCGE